MFHDGFLGLHSSRGRSLCWAPYTCVLLTCSHTTFVQCGHLRAHLRHARACIARHAAGDVLSQEPSQTLRQRMHDGGNVTARLQQARAGVAGHAAGRMVAQYPSPGCASLRARLQRT